MTSASSSTSLPSPSLSEKETDITIYGATSFVAKHIIRYLIEVTKTDLPQQSQPQQKQLRITLGGRNKTKLEAVRNSFADTKTSDEDGGEDSTSLSTKSIIQDVIVADGSDLINLKVMAKRSQVVLNCAGPYYLHSSLVVQACAEVGCDYVDITGEVGWASEMRARYGAAAKTSGARIISLCGYDSIPSDISVYCAIQALKNSVGSGADVVQVKTARLWHQPFGMPNGGTITTFCQMPYNLVHDFTRPKNETNNVGGGVVFRPVPFFVGDPLSLSNPEHVVQNPEFEATKARMARSEWMNQLLSIEPDLFYGISLPFPMSFINTKVIQASAVALGYGNDFTVQERFVPIGYFFTKLFSIFALFPMAVLLFFVNMSYAILRLPTIGRTLADAVAPPGSGMPDSLCAIGSNAVYVKIDAVTSTKENTNNNVKAYTAYSYFSFQGDAGNTVTAQCVSEAALVLVYNRDKLPPRSEDGFGTPAQLLGGPLLQRLKETKVRKVTVKVSIDSPIL